MSPCPLCGARFPDRCDFMAHAKDILAIPLAPVRPEVEDEAEDIEALIRAEQEREENARSTRYDMDEERGMDRRRGIES